MISIIVPVYNEEKYLPKCLDSLVNQTYQDLEIICVNDGSTDGSLEILEQYAAKDDRIKVVSQENQGLSGARNAGIAEVKGEWMMFVDSDDWLELDCCERAINYVPLYDIVFFSYIREFKLSSSPRYLFGKAPKKFVGQDMEWLYERIIAPKGSELADPTKIDSPSTAWGKLYKTDIVKHFNIVFLSRNEVGSEDIPFNVEYMKYAKSAYYIPNCFYHYRKFDSDTLSYTYKPDWDKLWLRMFDVIKMHIEPMGTDVLVEALNRRMALCLFGIGLNIVFNKESLKWKYDKVDNILKSHWYVLAIKHLDTSPMPLHWKCFYGSARHKQTWAVLLMLQIMNLIINR